MFIHSIRWRLQIWLAFLLACVLLGFGATVFQLYRVRQLDQIDSELERRVSTLTIAVRGGPSQDRVPDFSGGDRGSGRRGDGGRGGFGRGPRGGAPDFNRDPNAPSPEGGNFDPTGEGGFRGPRPGPRGSPEGFDRSGEPGRGRGRGGPPLRDFEITGELGSLFPLAGPNDFYFAVWSRDGGLFKLSASAPSDVPRPVQSRMDSGTHLRTRGNFRESFHYTGLGDAVLAGRDITSDLEAMKRFGWVLAAAGGTILSLSLGGVGWIITRAIRPLDEMSATAKRISAGNLAERIQVAKSDDELGRLAGVLNSTFARLEAAFDRQRQFTADAAHELRTPIAVLISEAQTTLARKRSTDEYRQAVEVSLTAAQEMKRLTESLLDLASVDGGPQSSQRSRMSLARIVAECADLVRPLVNERGLQLHCELEPAEVACNPDRLRQVATNLLTNAVHYNRPQGEIRVGTHVANGSVLLTVADTGIGIGPADLPHVFERFYRADRVRSRSEGHSGLGLAICKAIVEDEGGKIEVSSQLGQGTTFTVTFPSVASAKNS